MKSIVFLSHLHDEHERGGAYLRNYALLSILESWGFKTHSFYRGEFRLLPQRLKKFIMGLRFGKEVRSLFTSSFFKVPSCDILILDTFKYFSWDLSFENRKPLLIYNAHNLEFENHFGKEDSQRKRAFAAYECECLLKMDIVLVCSDREKKLLCLINEELRSKVFVFPNLVSIKRFEHANANKRRYISFIGTLDYYPNIEAVKYLANRFYPNLPEELKEKFVIAGRRPSDEVRLLCEQRGITLKLDLTESEMTALFMETTILLVPLEHGSGTRLKIIEGALAGCLILTTEVGCEGIDKRGMVVSTLDNFLENFLKLWEQEDDYKEAIESSFLEDYELEAWANKNRTSFLEFVREKLS
jgi:hypothetical protein